MITFIVLDEFRTWFFFLSDNTTFMSGIVI